jgi:hypothetical protein
VLLLLALASFVAGQCLSTAVPGVPGSSTRVCDTEAGNCFFSGSTTSGAWDVTSAVWRYALVATYVDLAPGQFGSVQMLIFNSTTNITTTTLTVNASALLNVRFLVVFRNCFGNSSVLGNWVACSASVGIVPPTFTSSASGADLIYPIPLGGHFS